MKPQIEFVDSTSGSIRYLEHGWPNPLCRWHSHFEHELHFIVEGTGKALIGDRIDDFEAGDLYLLGSHIPHNWVTEENSDPIYLRDMLIQFDVRNIDNLGKIFPEVQELHPLTDLSKSGVQFINIDPKEIYCTLKNIKNSTGTARFTFFLNLLSRLLKHPEKKKLLTRKSFEKFSVATKDQIDTVIEYILKNYRESLCLKEVAKIIGMKESSFSRYFHKRTGNRFTDFVNRFRIGQSCTLLSESNEQISAVCYRVGYRNLANFNRHFQRIKRMSPREYRKQTRKYLQSIPE